MTDEAWTWHGGAIAAAKRRFDAGKRPWLDLSTGINPNPWPGVASVDIDWHRLPEQEALAELEAAAAAFFGVDPRHVCAVPGTEVGLRLAGTLIGGHAHHVAPGYRTHGEMFGAGNAIDASEAPSTEATLILANPNNPDGRITGRDRLADLLASRDDEQWLLVDEAFADCDPSASIAAWVGEAARLLVFRSFGKFFGLAGLRLGFVLGPQAFLVRLREQLGAWPVSAAAIAIGTAAYRDASWAASARARLRADADALDRVLRRRGYLPRGDCPLFRLIETSTARDLFDRLAHAAILTRPFADRPYWLRFGLPGDDAALARLDAALADG
ncbi:MAG: aminotransferase class I/II-fold pyridoxal phosphate-dependent enzyme [Sphingomonadales bacterium]|nr:aminotransferase class I/II-fold pyridoxal phosphate-dependent enzyme [Sphingomonadales bacterium]